jgi:hypothetical protein
MALTQGSTSLAVGNSRLDPVAGWELHPLKTNTLGAAQN